MEGTVAGSDMSSMVSSEVLTAPEVLSRSRDHGDEANVDMGAGDDDDWGDLDNDQWLGGGTYFEYYCAEENMFYYSNPETGHTTWDEPDEEEFDIARYHDKLGVGDWSPPHREPAPPQEESSEFFTISAVVSRECSMNSLASLRNSPTKVDLVHQTSYRALLNHLRDEPSTQLAQWREREAVVDGLESHSAPLGQGCASIQGEIPDLADVELSPVGPILGQEPRRPKNRLLRWGLLACSVAIVATVLLKR